MDAEHVCDGTCDGHVALALARDDDGGESESGTEVPEESTMVPITMPGMLRMQSRRTWTGRRPHEACGGEAGGWREVEKGVARGLAGRAVREEGVVVRGEGVRGVCGVCRVGPAVRRQRT